MSKLDSFIKVALQLGKSVKPVVKSKIAKVKPTPIEKVKENILKQIGAGTKDVQGGGGFTIDPRTGEMLDLGTQRGFMMSPIENVNAVQIPYSPNITEQDILNAIPAEYWPRLQRGANLGSWVDSGQVYIDPAERYVSKIASLVKGLKSKQLSGADLSRGFGDTPGPFYDVTQKDLNDLIKLRALQTIKGVGATGGLGTAGYLGYEGLK